MRLVVLAGEHRPVIVPVRIGAAGRGYCRHDLGNQVALVLAEAQYLRAEDYGVEVKLHDIAGLEHFLDMIGRAVGPVAEIDELALQCIADRQVAVKCHGVADEVNGDGLRAE